MASGQSSESDSGEAEHKKRRFDSLDRDYYSLSGDSHAGVSSHLTGSRIQPGQGYQRQDNPSTHSISSNYESGNDLFNVGQTDFQQQLTHGVSSDPMGRRIQGWQDYHSQRYPVNQSVPSNHERRSDSYDTRQSGLPSQITPDYSRNPIGSGFQAWPYLNRQGEIQTTPPHYESLPGNYFNVRQSGQMPHEISSDQTGTRIQAEQDYQIQHYSLNQSLVPTYGSQSDSFNSRQSNLPPQITAGFSSDPTGRVQAGHYQGQHYPATQGLPSRYERVSSYPMGGGIYAGQDQRLRYPATQMFPLYHESQNAPYSVYQTEYNFPSQSTQGISSNPTGRETETLPGYQGQNYPATHTISSISARDIDSLNTRQSDWPTQMTTQGVLSDQIESDGEASRNNIEPISTDESRSDSFTQKLFDLAQEITMAELEELKLLCNDKLPRRKLDLLRHPGHLFVMLRDKNLISESNTALLEEMLCKIGRNALVGKYFIPSTYQGISLNPRINESGQYHPPSMTPSNFESRGDSSQQATDGVLSVKLSALVDLLKNKYKRHYSKLIPIPWNDEIHLNLHEVYTTLEVKKVKGVTHKMGEALENLHDMFKSADDRLIRIEGAPAMGKSTLCRKLAYDWACGELKQYTLLFFLEMRHVVKHNMIAEICNQLIPDGFDLSSKELSDLILKYKTSVIFLCDGLDELDDGHLPDTEIPQLISGDLYYQCTVVTTTRPHLCDKYLNTYDLFLIVKGFTSDRTNEYILKYFQYSISRGDLLIKQIEKQKDRSDFITDLLENPLHVSFMCILWEYHKLQGYSFPETLTELYSEILECILKRYCAKNKINLIDSEVPREIVSEIDALALDSYTAYRNNKRTFDKSDISSEASLNFGLLVKDLGHALRKFREIYFFYHMTWLEYFTALHVTSQLKSKNTKILQEFIKTPQKSFQILKFVAGNVSEETGSLFFTELNKNLQKIHGKLQSFNTDCENMRKTVASLQNRYGDCIKFLCESKYSKALITCFDVLHHRSIVYTHEKNRTLNYYEISLLALKYSSLIKLGKKHCSFQHFLHFLQLIGKTSITLETLCVLGFEDKKINRFLHILKGNPIHVKYLIIYSDTKWTLTDTDNLAAMIKNFRGESITLSLNVDATNEGNNSGLKNVIERIKENTSVKYFKFEAYQCDDILPTMTYNGTLEIVCTGVSWTVASVNTLFSFLENCDTTESLKLYMGDLSSPDLILKIKTALMKISPSLKSLHLLYPQHELCMALSDNMTLNDIGMGIRDGRNSALVCSVIKQNKYARSMTIYYYYYYRVTDEMCQSIAAALRENKVLKHLKIETRYDYNALNIMNNVLIPVIKDIETNQVTLDSITLRAFIQQNSSACTELQSIVSEQEKPDNWYHHVYQSVHTLYDPFKANKYSELHYHIIRYTSEHISNAM